LGGWGQKNPPILSGVKAKFGAGFNQTAREKILKVKAIKPVRRKFGFCFGKKRILGKKLSPQQIGKK